VPKVTVPIQSIFPPGTTGQVTRSIDEAGQLGASFAGAAGRLQQMQTQLETARSNARNTALASSRVAAAKRAYLMVWAQRQQDPLNHETLVQDMESLRLELIGQAGMGVSDEATQLKIQSDVNTFIQGKLAEAEFLSNKQAATERKSQLDQATADQATVVDMTTPGTPAYNQEIQKGLDDIDAAAQVGTIDLIEAGTRKREFKSNAQSSLANQMILSDPGTAYDVLSDPTRFRDLTPTRRTSLLGRAQRAAEAADRRLDAQRERATREERRRTAERQESNVAKWWSEVRNDPAFYESGEARAILEQLRYTSLIKSEDYLTMSTRLDAVEKQGGFDDPMSIRQVEGQIHTGILRGRDATAAVTSLRLDNKVSNESFNRLMTLAEADPVQMRDADTREAGKYLQGMLGLFKGLVGGSFSATLVSRARVEFYQRVTAEQREQDAAGMEMSAMQIAQEMIPRYLNLVKDAAGPGLEESRFGSATEAKQAFDAGLIDRVQYDQEQYLWKFKEIQSKVTPQPGQAVTPQQGGDLVKAAKERQAAKEKARR